MKTDAELLLSYADSRSETDFAGFVGRRVGFVYHAALRQSGGDAQAAEDVTQAVFALAARRAAELARHAQLAGWLYSTTTHIARRAWRDARLRATREQEAARMNEVLQNDANYADAANTADVAEIADAARLRPLLDEALGALRESERDAVLLRFFENRGFAEIGVALKLSEDAARMRVARAVEKMRATFTKRGVTSSAAALGALMTAEAAQAAPAGLAASVSTGAIATAGAAAATTATMGTSAILAFMSSAKITTAAIVAILVAAGGVYYGVRNEGESAASLAQARLENKNLAEQLRGLEKREAVANGSAPAPKRTPLEAGQALLAEHPEIKEKVLALDNAKGLERTFRIAKALNLSPEKSEQLAEIWGRGSAITTYKVSGYGDVTFAPVGRKLDWDEIHALLGDADFERFKHLVDLDYGGINRSRELSIRLYLTDAPLTSQQAWAIDEISYDLGKNFPEDTEPESCWKIFQERAESILSPEQMKAFTEVGDGYIYLKTISKMRRESEKASATKSK